MTHLEVHIRRKAFPASPRPILEELRFAAEQGDFVGIVGPSGAGKTTILNIVGGLDRDLDGEVLLNGASSHARAGSIRCGYMFQEPRLMPWLSVEDNVTLVLEDDPQASERARHLLHEVELEGFEHAYPLQLSGGMQRRVALARAVAVRPALLLMDEPFLSLDLPTANRLRGQLLTLWQELGPTVLFVTHDLREALTLCDRVIFLSGSPARVVKELAVALTRPRDPHGVAVGELHDRLLREQPGLLAGLAASRDYASDNEQRRTA